MYLLRIGKHDRSWADEGNEAFPESLGHYANDRIHACIPYGQNRAEPETISFLSFPVHSEYLKQLELFKRAAISWER